MSAERCPVCDREACPTLRRFCHRDYCEDADPPQDFAACPGCAAEADCRAHAVDWRAEALALRAEKARPLTVGAALAMPEVQDGSHVVEYMDLTGVVCHGVQQARANQHGTLVARCHLSEWTAWEFFDVGAIAEMALPCRLVPAATCNDDPDTRGPIQ